VNTSPPSVPEHDFDGADPVAASVLAAFRRISHLNRQLLMKIVGARGGHPAQAGCLRMLAAHEGVSQRELAEMLHLSPPAVTTTLQKLETDGLIERTSDAADQRLTRIHLTEEGRARSEEMRASFLEFLDTTIGRLSKADQLELERLLATLADYTAEALGSSAEAPSR
jgi:DNA-binding MarR family transcriptional regulator